MTYQRCPVCDGSGLVNRPPHIAADQLHYTSSSCGPWPCPTCGGLRIINVNTGQPPMTTITLTPEAP